MATHYSILAWEVPWTEEPGGLQSLDLQRAGHELLTKQQQQGQQDQRGRYIFETNLSCEYRQLKEFMPVATCEQDQP